MKRLLRETQGQDMIEYALMVSVIAVACGAILPPINGSISTIFSKITSLVAVAVG